ncbi:MAG: hypothetical protein A4E45_01656 [Methanosaeta sp. PtaB.Bin039]|nr:MAG: hypothetical protein A4E45_01656 [Methanosaeta sp. PtaB.Bin039]OPY46317.1 MAG: hypothetical protein A4E47_00615 [Methanosaeta sp. PtaU1.Bin028]
MINANRTGSPLPMVLSEIDDIMFALTKALLFANRWLIWPAQSNCGQKINR